MDPDNYKVFQVLSNPRKLQFIDYLFEYGIDKAMKLSLKSVLIPNGSQLQRIISFNDFKGRNVEIVGTSNSIHIQSNYKESIDIVKRRLFLGGEVLVKDPKMNIENDKVFRIRENYRVLDIHNPLCMN